MAKPWKIEYELDGPYIFGEFGGADVYINVDVSAIGTPPTFREHVAIEQAPLDLIAAAPVILEALHDVVDSLSRRPLLEAHYAEQAAEYALTVARQALAAARGEEAPDGTR